MWFIQGGTCPIAGDGTVTTQPCQPQEQLSATIYICDYDTKQ